MKRFVSVLAVVVVCLGVVGCVGNTDPATNITNLSAKLNAHGFTNNGPATWWWEYDTVKSDLGTANDSEVCGNPPEADKRCGPASGGTPAAEVAAGPDGHRADAEHDLLLPRLRPGPERRPANLRQHAQLQDPRTARPTRSTASGARRTRPGATTRSNFRTTLRPTLRATCTSTTPSAGAS